MSITKQLLAISMMVLVMSACGKADDDDDDATKNITVKGGIGANSNLNLIEVSDGKDPLSFKMIIYKVGFSTSEFCESPTVVELGDSYLDFSVSAELGAGVLADGSYKCVIIEMGSIIKVTPSVDSANAKCKKSVEFEMDVCRSDSTGTLIDETAVTCTTDTNDRVAIYLSTVAVKPDEDFFRAEIRPFSAPPTADSVKTGGSPLLNALVVSGATTGTFVAGANGMVGESLRQEDTGCSMGEPSWDFQ